MGVLTRGAAGEQILLPARLLVGRGGSCDLRIQDARVSGEHATLLWSGRGWQVRDLGSRNGTYVNGERVAARSDVTVEHGTGIAFGDPSVVWTLTDDEAPCPFAQALDTGVTQIAQGELLALPGPDAPSWVVFPDTPAGWVAEGDAESFPVKDRDVLVVEGRAWRLHLPEVLERTWASRRAPLLLPQLSLRFEVSRDEEYVRASLVSALRTVDLEARAHHYLLLTLARARLQDLRLPSAEQGWLETDALLRMLRVDRGTLNMQVYRARQQLSAADVIGAARLIERRPGTGQIRLGLSRVEIQSLREPLERPV